MPSSHALMSVMGWRRASAPPVGPAVGSICSSVRVIVSWLFRGTGQPTRIARSRHVVNLFLG
jgi:hypothetical protein